MSKSLHVAIVGATGAVGIELIKLLEKRKFPVGKLTLLTSARSAGNALNFSGQSIQVQALGPDSFKDVNVALFSAGSSVSKEFAPIAVQSGAIVVDNSSAFRMEADVPLVVPEINAADIKKHKGIIANPNCTTAITLMALYPLHREFRVRRVIASSYQAVSGTGAQAIEELRQQVQAIAEGRPIEKKVYPHQIAFNVLPHVDSFLERSEEHTSELQSHRDLLSFPTRRSSDLRQQVQAIAEGRPIEKKVYPHQIAFNVLPHVDSFLE